MENQYLDGFREAIADWVDQRFLSRKQLYSLAMFSLYLVNLLEHEGWAYYGHSHKQTGNMGCLVVKADVEGLPQVVFTNGHTYTSCVTIFIRRLEAGALVWRPDKYRR